MKIGSRDIIGVKIGSRDIVRVMHGTREIWAADAPEPGAHTGVATWTAPGAGVNAGTNRFGWVFTVGATPITVSKLRHFKYDASAATWRVIIHRNSDNAVMAQADISFGAGENDAWKEAVVSPVALAAGVTYTVSARVVSGTGFLYRNPVGVVYASAITVVDDGVFGSNNDNRPTSNSAQVYTPTADFAFTL